MYKLFIDNLAFPITPSKIDLKIKNNNKSINLIDTGDVNIVKSPGLSEINVTLIIPLTRYPFAYYPNGFQSPNVYISKLEDLKVNKKHVVFILTRSSQNRLLNDSSLLVTLEDYTISENASNGQDFTAKCKFKQFKPYGTKQAIINVVKNTINVEEPREEINAPDVLTYTVVSGDTLWNISKLLLNNGARYTEIAELNNIANPNLIYPGDILEIPEREWYYGIKN